MEGNQSNSYDMYIDFALNLELGLKMEKKQR